MTCALCDAPLEPFDHVVSLSEADELVFATADEVSGGAVCETCTRATVLEAVVSRIYGQAVPI